MWSLGNVEMNKKMDLIRKRSVVRRTTDLLWRKSIFYSFQQLLVMYFAEQHVADFTPSIGVATGGGGMRRACPSRFEILGVFPPRNRDL